MERRQVLKSFPFAATAVALPTAPLLSAMPVQAAGETPMDEIGRLAKRIGRLLPQLPDGAFDRVQIDANGVMMSYARHDRRPDAVLFQLLEEWRAQYDRVNSNPVVYDDVGDDPEFQALIAIEGKVAATTPTTVEGFAAKLLALTSFGQFDLDGPAECLFADARSVTTFLPPSTLKSPRL